MRRFPTAVAIGLLAIVLAAPALAHPEEGKPAEHEHYTLLVMEKVDPSNLAAYEASTRAWVETFGAADTDLGWFTASGPSFTYAYLMSLDSYAELETLEDRYMEVLGEAGEERMAELMAGQEHVERRWHELLRERQDLSYTGKAPPEGPPGVIHVTVFTVKPSKQQQFEALMGQVRDAYAKAEHPHGFEVSQVQFGEGSYVMVNQGASMVELYGRPDGPTVLTGAIGAEKTQALVGEYLECLTDMKSTDWRPRPELSVMAPPAEAGGE